MKMHHCLACILGLVGLFSSAFTPAHAGLFDPETMMKVEEIQPGMRGTGKSVFRGTQPEPFGVTVLGIWEKFDADADIILIRIDSGPPVHEDFGVAQGMSGSPIYINGKLIGALSLTPGFFPKKPIAGVTPIQQMLDTVEPRSTAPPPPSLAVGVYRPRHRQPVVVEGRRVDTITVADRKAEAPAHTDGPLTLMPVATPLIVHGLPANALKRLKELLEPFNVVPVLGPGRASNQIKTPPLEPGSAVAVSLTRGDIDMSGVGTLTCILKDGTLLAFGHSMLGLGSTELPLTGAYVHGVFASQEIAFKLASPLNDEMGAITEDRSWSIAGKIGGEADMLDADYLIHDARRRITRHYRVEVFRQKTLTSLFVGFTMDSALGVLSSSFDEGSQRARLRVEADGFPPIEWDNLFSTDSRSSRFLFSGGGSPTSELSEVIDLFANNRFKEAKVSKVSATIELSQEKRSATLESVTPSRTRVKPGETVDLAVRLRQYGQPVRLEQLSIQIPEQIPAGPLQLAVSGGQSAFLLKTMLGIRPATPTTLQQTVDLLQQRERNDHLYLIAAPMASFGLEVSGQKLTGLPHSIAEIFRFGNPYTFRLVREDITRSQPMNLVISGGQVVTILVEPEEREKVGSTSFYGGIPSGGSDQSLSSRSGFLSGDGFDPGEFDSLQRTPRPPATRVQWLKQVLSPDGSMGQWINGSMGQWESAAMEEWRHALASSSHEPIDPQSQSYRLAAAPPKAAPSDVPVRSDKVDTETPPKMPTWDEVQAVGEDEAPTTAGVAVSGRDSKGRTAAIGRAPTTWVQSTEKDFAAGKTEGSTVTSDGKVTLAPTLEPKAVDTQLVVFAQATDRKGNLYLGTWIEGQVLRVDPDGKTETLLKTSDPAITALAVDGEGNVYAGSAPSGVIYKIAADGKSTAWCDLSETYIWSIEPDRQGNLYAATGSDGRVYKVTADGKSHVVLETPDRHVLALAADPSGNVYAGTYPRGKVYRIRADGAVSSVYETPSRYAVQSLAVDEQGNLYVGTTGTQARVFKVEPDGEEKELFKGSRERHVYSMVSDGANVYVGTGPRGKIYRLSGDETVATLAQPDDLYITTMANQSGTLYIATGSAGHVLQLPFNKKFQGTYISTVKDVGTVATWGVVRWQARGMPDARIAFQTRTGNTAYPDDTWSDWSPQVADPRGSHIQSPPGRYIQYRANLFSLQPGAMPMLERVEVVYMTKNRPPQLTLRAPTGGEVWSGQKTINWSARDPDRDRLTFQAFLSPDNGKTWEEIKGETKKPSEEETEGESKDDAEKPAAPDKPGAPDDGADDKGMFKPVPPRKGKGTASRSAPQPPRQPGQPSGTSGPGRVPGEGIAPPEFSEPEPPEPPEPSSDAGGSPSSRTWDTTKVPDGVYLIKVTVTDKVSNPKDARTDEKISGPVTVDNTPPQLTLPAPPKQKPTQPLIVKASDATTYIVSAEYRIDSGEWVAAAAADGVFDMANEDIEIAAENIIQGKHTLEIRVRDAASNETTAKLEYAWGKTQPPSPKP